jgi:hypothetical protein
VRAEPIGGAGDRPGGARQGLRLSRASRIVVVTLLAWTLGAGWAQTCRIEVEPNDTPATATPLGEARCLVGELDDAQDAFVWDVGGDDAARPWVVEIEGIPGHLTQLDLIRVTFAPDGVAVAAADRLWTFGTPDGQLRSSSPILLPAGRIYLGLSKSGGSGRYVAHLRPQARALDRDHRPFDRMTAATGAFAAFGALDATAPREIAWTLDEDDGAHLWGIEGQVSVGGTARLTLEGPSGRVATSILTQEDGVVVANLGLAPGAYRLRLEGDAGVVTLRTLRQGRPTDGREVEPNDDRGSANLMNLERPFEGAAERIDWIAVDVPPDRAAQAFDLVVEAAEVVTVTLTDASGVTLQQRRGSSGRLRALVLGEGRSYVMVEGRGAIPYRLTFEPGVAAGEGYEVEPNDVFDRATPLTDDLTLRGTLDPQDIDVLSFTVDGEPGLWRIQVVGGGVTRLSSFDGGRTPQASASGEGRLRLDQLLLAPGTHYLEVRGEGDYAVRAIHLGPAPVPPAATTHAATEPAPLVAEPAATDPEAPGAGAVSAEPVAVPSDPGPPPPAGWLESEPNDDEVRAEPLPVGITRVGSVPDGDRDVYRFTIEHDAYVRIEAMPPADGQLVFDTSGLNRTLASGVGEPTVLQRWLLAGDYVLTLWAVVPFDGYYQLRLTLLDPLALPADLEPNDTRETAVPLPAELVVVGRVGEMRDDDYYALPTFETDTTMRIEAELASAGLTLFAGSSLERDGPGAYVANLAAGERAQLRVRGTGTYRLAFAFDAAPAPGQLRPPAGDAGVEVAVAPSTLEVAAFSSVGQVVEGELTLHHTAAQPTTITFEAAASQLPVRIELPPGLTLAGGERRTVPFRIVLPADLRDDPPLRITFGVRSDAGLATVALPLAARCEAEPVAPFHDVPLPAALVGHLNVAWAPFGATIVDSEGGNDRYLHDGATSPGRGASRPVGGSFVLDLPGPDPIRLTGTLLHPQSRGVLEQLRRFAIDVSLDGVTFLPVMEGRLEAARIEQAFAFDRPVLARYVRLTVLDAHREAYAQSTWLGEWQLLTDDHRVVGAIDLADPDLGGVMVWSDPLLPENAVLPGDPAHARIDGRGLAEAVWVIGFQHARAAQVERLVWVESERSTPDQRFAYVRVEASVVGPIGPWLELGAWDLDLDATGSAALELARPTWARYLRFSAGGHDPAQRSVFTPETIHVFERPSDAYYTTILGAWGHNRAAGPYEASLAATLGGGVAVIDDDGSDDVRDGARPVADGDIVRGSVLVAEDEDWYRIDVPVGANVIDLRLDADDAVRHRLSDERGRPIYYEVDMDGDGLRLRAFVEPGSYYLHLDEPKRSVVFSWDTSGSVGPFLPITYASVASFARDLDPDREVAQLLAFAHPEPAWLLPYWSGDASYVTRYLSAFDRSTADSSDAETALLAAVRALGEREGVRAVLLITDHETGSYAQTPELWRAIEAARPRIFTFEVSSGGTGITQDRMQAYAAANGGFYDYARNVGDFDVGFRRAACALRRPKAYTLTVAIGYAAPPGPGALQVERGPGAADLQPAVAVVFDASGSMGALLPDGTPRIDAARAVVRELVDVVLPEGTPFALRAYGHVQPTTCDTRLELPLGPLDRAAAARAIAGIQPKLLSGTPLAASIEALAGDLAGARGPKTVVLITDGEESCGGDVEAAVRALAADPDLRLSIVGFALAADVAGAAGERFRAWAALGGGSYLEAFDRDGLAAAVVASLEAPELRFTVLDAAGTVVAEGVVDGAPVPLPGGPYRVRIGDAERTFDLSVRPEALSRLVIEGAE